MKIGDKVKIVKKWEGGPTRWRSEMDVSLGKEGVIVDCTLHLGTVCIRTQEAGEWYYYIDCLELIEKTPTLNLYFTTGKSSVGDEEAAAAFKPSKADAIAKALRSIQKHPLQFVFDDVIAQVETGKGAERHANGNEFMDQPWVGLAKTHGIGFLTGQSAKKLAESQSMKERDRWEREMFGVISYAAMAILYSRMENERA